MSHLSTVELKRELKSMVSAEALAACIERPDFEKLHAESKAAALQAQPPKQEPPAQAAAKERAPAQATGAQTEDTGLPFGLSWQNLIFFGLLVYWVSNGLGLTGGGGTTKEPEVLAGAGESAVLQGQVVELKTHGDFEATLKLHCEQTALPVVVDFYSNGCGKKRVHTQ